MKNICMMLFLLLPFLANSTDIKQIPNEAYNKALRIAQKSCSLNQFVKSCLSPEGLKFVTYDKKGLVQLWDGKSGDLLDDAVAPLQEDVISLYFDPQGTKVIIETRNGQKKFSIVNPETLKKIKEAYSDRISFIVLKNLSHDQKMILTSDNKGVVKLWDNYSGTCLDDSVGTASGKIVELDFNQDNTKALVTTDRPTVMEFNIVNAPGLMKIYKDHKPSIIIFKSQSPNKSMIVTFDNRNTIMLWDGETGLILDSSIAFISDKETKFWFNQNSTKIIVETKSGKREFDIIDSKAAKTINKYCGPGDNIQQKWQNPDKKKILTINNRNVLLVWVSDGSSWSIDTEKLNVLSSTLRSLTFEENTVIVETTDSKKLIITL